MQKGNVHYSSD